MEAVIVEIPGIEENSNSSYPNRKVEVDAIATQKQDPTGLRSRKKVQGCLTVDESHSPAIPSNLKMGNDDDSPSENFTEKEAEDDNDEDDDLYTKGVSEAQETKDISLKFKVMAFLEFCLFVCITLVLILSVTLDKLKNITIWHLEFWKWCVFVLAMFCGRLLSEWFINIPILVIERRLFNKRKLMALVYILQTRVRVFIWLGLVLLTWRLLISHGVHRSPHTTKVLNYITRVIAATFVVCGAWIFRTLFINMLFYSFYEQRFSVRMNEDDFQQYILRSLSSPPSLEGSETMETIDLEKLQKMRKMIRGCLSTVWRRNFFVKRVYAKKKRDEQKDRNITNEWEAQNVAYAIYTNVAKPEHKYIDGDDLLRFMSHYDVKRVLQLFEGASESRKIKKKSFRNWVVNVYMKHKFLEYTLNDILTALDDVEKFVTGLTVVVLIILWLILMRIVSTEVLLFISSQFLVAVFTFGTTAKSTLDGVMFMLVTYPYEVGDRCVVDGIQVVVEKMSILTTVFLRYDNEKIYYPNSLLATKAISNFNRSPQMSDSVDFDLDVSTSVENILALKAKIKTYIKSRPQLWRRKHSVRVREIEDVNKIKMSLYVTHTINFQNYEETSDRRSNLVLDLKNIFEEIGIKCHILPPTSSSN